MANAPAVPRPDGPAEGGAPPPRSGWLEGYLRGVCGSAAKAAAVAQVLAGRMSARQAAEAYGVPRRTLDRLVKKVREDARGH